MSCKGIKAGRRQPCQHPNSSRGHQLLHLNPEPGSGAGYAGTPTVTGYIRVTDCLGVSLHRGVSNVLRLSGSCMA
jgi:hypothetical protein